MPGSGPPRRTRHPLHLARDLGVVAMLVVEPWIDDPGLEDGLFAAAERYLRAAARGCSTRAGSLRSTRSTGGFTAAASGPGILGAHDVFHRAVEPRGVRAGRAARCSWRSTCSDPEPRDPRGLLVRRQTRVEETDDALPASWWDNLAIGEFRPALYRLLSRTEETEYARAPTWDMAWFGRVDGRARIGLIAVEVHPDHRRKGFGRFLVGEILRRAREQANAVVAVQTGATNTAAVGLYKSLGFQPVETATLYRRPGGRTDPGHDRRAARARAVHVSWSTCAVR